MATEPMAPAVEDQQNLAALMLLGHAIPSVQKLRMLLCFMCVEAHLS